jgi:adenine-specific DNA-methyltransferase
MVIFAFFELDPEAGKDIDEIKWPGVTLIKAKMNNDLLTEDLKRRRSSNESFWLVGSPDVLLTKIDSENWKIEILGFDYYNTKTGQIESGGANKIAVWLLDTNYDGRNLFPRQVFLPLADDKSGWSKLARNLKAEIDESLMEQYRGTVSLQFKTGDFKRIAVKVIDDRGIESLKIMELNE